MHLSQRISEPFTDQSVHRTSVLVLFCKMGSYNTEGDCSGAHGKFAWAWHGTHDSRLLALFLHLLCSSEKICSGKWFWSPPVSLEKHFEKPNNFLRLFVSNSRSSLSSTNALSGDPEVMMHLCDSVFLAIKWGRCLPFEKGFEMQSNTNANLNLSLVIVPGCHANRSSACCCLLNVFLDPTICTC